MHGCMKRNELSIMGFREETDRNPKRNEDFMATLHDTKTEFLEQVLAHVRERLPQDKAAHIATFASEYYRLIAPEDLIERSPLDLYGAVMAHWNLSQHRALQECKVHVYTPQVEAHGWQSPHTIIEIITDDMPFLVDSVSMEVTRHGYAIHLILAPIMYVRRDAQGQLLEVLPPDAAPGDTITEALLHVEVDQQREPAVLDELRQDLVRVLGQVRAVVEDWPKMRHILQQIAGELDTNPPPIDQEEVAEARALLVWLEDGNFIFLGSRAYDLLTRTVKTGSVRCQVPASAFCGKPTPAWSRTTSPHSHRRCARSPSQDASLT